MYPLWTALLHGTMNVPAVHMFVGNNVDTAPDYRLENILKYFLNSLFMTKLK